jgi:hypothetical protein
MSTWGVLIVRLRKLPDAADLSAWRRDLLVAFDLDYFSHRGPLRIIVSAADGPIPIDDGSAWLDVGLVLSYYAKGYERGDPELFVRLAEWLEGRIPAGEVWYGHDAADESIRAFGTVERAALLAYFRRVGHEPYDSKLRQSPPRDDAELSPAAPPRSSKRRWLSWLLGRL